MLLGRELPWKSYYDNEPIVTSIPSKIFFKNRYFRLILFMLICLLMTAIYIGWQDLQMVFYDMKLYHWHCTGKELVDGSRTGVLCDEQYRRIQVLYIVAQSSEFAFSIVAGACIDYIGPLKTVIIGFLMYITGWLIMLVSSQQFNAYVFGIFLIGSSVNMLGYPCLELEELFPTKRQLALSLVIACQTGSSLVPLLMRNAIDKIEKFSARTMLILYLLLIVCPLFAMSIFSFPYTRLFLMKEAVMHGDDAEVNYNGKTCDSLTDEFGSMNLLKHKDQDLEGQEKEGYSTVLVESNSRWNKRLRGQIFNTIYFVFLAYYTLSVLSHGYYPTVVRINFSSSVADFQGYFYPTQAIWGVVLGFFVDYVGSILMCYLLTAMFLLAIASALSKTSLTLQYISSITFIVANAYIYTTKYIFVSENYDKTNFGILVGLIGFSSGLICYCNIIFESYVAFSAMIYVYLCVQAISIACLVILHTRLRKSLNPTVFSKETSSKVI